MGVGNTGGVGRTDAELAADLAGEAGRLLLSVRDEISHDFPPRWATPVTSAPTRCC